MVANSAAHEWPATGSATTPTVIDPDLFAVILYLWSCSAPESDHRYKITGGEGGTEAQRGRERPGHRGVSNDLAVCVSGADDGNRTRVISLGS